MQLQASRMKVTRKITQRQPNKIVRGRDGLEEGEEIEEVEVAGGESDSAGETEFCSLCL